MNIKFQSWQLNISEGHPFKLGFALIKIRLEHDNAPHLANGTLKVSAVRR